MTEPLFLSPAFWAHGSFRICFVIMRNKQLEVAAWANPTQKPNRAASDGLVCAILKKWGKHYFPFTPSRAPRQPFRDVVALLPRHQWPPRPRAVAHAQHAVGAARQPPPAPAVASPSGAHRDDEAREELEEGAAELAEVGGGVRSAELRAWRGGIRRRLTCVCAARKARSLHGARRQYRRRAGGDEKKDAPDHPTARKWTSSSRRRSRRRWRVHGAATVAPAPHCLRQQAAPRQEACLGGAFEQRGYRCAV